MNDSRSAPLARVFGAGGCIGTQLAPRLVAHHCRVRAARHPTSIASRDRPGAEPGRRLRSNVGLSAPGSGVLQFEVEPAGGGAQRIAVSACWHPRGVRGLAYWIASAPSHAWLFADATREIARRAEALPRDPACAGLRIASRCRR